MRKLYTYPWEIISGLSGGLDESDGLTSVWHPFVLSSETNYLANAVNGHAFPSKKVSDDFTVFELHGPMLKGEMSKSLIITDSDTNEIRLHFFDKKYELERKSLVGQFEPFFDQMMDNMLLLVRDGLNIEKFNLKNHYWPEISEIILEDSNDDPAKYSLIVDLARPKTLMEPLTRVTDRPKRILRRIHDQERVQKVREIDTKCLIDLARRPGSHLAEKAGPKQRIMAIKRTESINTLENRVTRHCCELSYQASRRYLIKHKNISPTESKRVTDVSKMQRFSRHAPSKNSFQGVTRLLEPCKQPNYSLLMNSDYSRIWKAYVELVRNEDLRSELWIWHRRLWVDYMASYLAIVVNAFAELKGPEMITRVGEKTVLAKRKHSTGTWILPDSLPGPFIVDKGHEAPLTLYLIDGNTESLEKLSSKLSGLNVLNADYFLISSQAGKLEALPVYAMMPAPHLQESKYKTLNEKMYPSLVEHLELYNNSQPEVRCRGGWVLLANWVHSPGQADLVKTQVDGSFECWVSQIQAESSTWIKSRQCWESPILSMCGV
jgi:hypothetical protein